MHEGQYSCSVTLQLYCPSCTAVCCFGWPPKCRSPAGKHKVNDYVEEIYRRFKRSFGSLSEPATVFESHSHPLGSSLCCRKRGTIHSKHQRASLFTIQLPLPFGHGGKVKLNRQIGHVFPHTLAANKKNSQTLFRSVF